MKTSVRRTVTFGHRMRISIFSACILACTLLCTAADDTWIEVKSPHFTIISNASVKQAGRVAKNLEQFRVAVQAFLPKMKVDPGSPLMVFVTRSDSDMKALLPNDRQEKGAAPTFGLFLAGPERNFVLLSTETPPEETYHVIFHEYSHMIINLNLQNLPLWLYEGFAELLGYMTVSDRDAGLGKVRSELMEVLQRFSMPLPELMSVTRDSPYYRQRDKVGIFYSMSWALTHYLMLGDKQSHSAKLREFISLLQNGVPEQEAVRRALGDLKTLEKNLDLYIRSKSFYYYKVPLRLDIKEDQYAARTLSLAESLGLRGVLLVHGDRMNDAKAMLEQALRLEPRNAVANEGMGSLYWRLQDTEKAQKYFSAAAELDSGSFVAQYFAAQLVYERDQDLETSENFLRKAIAINPTFGPAYRMLSQILMAKEERLPEALELSRKAAALEPLEIDNRLNIGRILARMNRYDEAQSHAEHLLATVKTELEKAQVESLLSMIRDQRSGPAKASPRVRNGKPAGSAPLTQGTGAVTEDPAGLESREKLRNARRLSNLETGPAGKLSGSVLSVTCDYPAVMDVVLAVKGVQRKFRARNYYDVRYSVIGGSSMSGFEPCTELKGKYVEIGYLSVDGQEFSGLIQAVAIYK